MGSGSPPPGNNQEDKNRDHHLPQKSLSILREILSQRRATSASASCSNGCGGLSTDAILKMARGMLLQRNTQNFDIASFLLDEFFCTNSTVSPQKDDLQLALLLQAAVLRLSKKEWDRAKRLINICQAIASPSGNALHRVVSYFSVALQERIAKELGVQFLPDAQPGNLGKLAVCDASVNLQADLIKIYQLLPFCQLTDFTAIQAIVDNVASAKRVHLIDLGIKTGSQWPILMQALAARHDCPLELLKLTAVGTPEDSEIGKMLSSFAESMNIPFEFKLIVSELKDLREDFFEVSDDEVLAVYSELRLATLLSTPDHLLSLLRTIEKLNPCLMVVIEIEACTDSPVFLDRFDAALAVCAAVFECLEDCIERDNPCRAYLEGGFIWESARNVIISEGEERVCRHERLDFWRAFMSRFGFVEVALSDIAFCQLNLVAESNRRWGSCSIEVNGKGIIIGWKGSPIKSLSVWKFQPE